MTKYPSATFFALTLAITYCIGLPVAAASHGFLTIHIPVSIGALAIYVPALVAIVLVGLQGGRPGLRQLLGPLSYWRVGISWYAVALLAPAAIALSALGLHVILGGTLPRFPAPLPEELGQDGTPAVAVYFLIPAYFVLASMGEEIGWRGYALPRLQLTYSALTASLIIGFVWAVWHLPLSLTSGATQSQIPMAWYLPNTLALAVLFTWLYNSTDGSLLIATLFHATIQVTNVFIPILPAAAGDEKPYVLSVIITMLAALLVVIIFRSGALSRRRLEKVRLGGTNG